MNVKHSVVMALSLSFASVHPSPHHCRSNMSRSIRTGTMRAHHPAFIVAGASNHLKYPQGALVVLDVILFEKKASPEMKSLIQNRHISARLSR